MENIFANIPDNLREEFFETLVDRDAVRVERIVSRGHVTPAGQWCDQDRHEWVLLLRGAARLVFADGREVALAPGDWLEIPAHRKHRVAWTDPGQDTVWLAVHYR
ncbi:MAG: cupin domain-containing protein [Lysobacterales bacterium]